MKFRLFGGLQDALLDCLPKCMLCVRYDSNVVGLQMGRKKLAQETNIIKFIQSRRYFNAAIKLLLAKDKRKRLKEQTRFWMLQIGKLDDSGVIDDDSSVSIQSSHIRRNYIKSDPERLLIQDFSIDNIDDVTAINQQNNQLFMDSQLVSYAESNGKDHGQNLIPFQKFKLSGNRG